MLFDAENNVSKGEIIIINAENQHGINIVIN